jgi:hypothetical protein
MSPGVLRLPPVWKNGHDVWFAQEEAQFHIHKIDSEEDRSSIILAAIGDTSVLVQVFDCIRNPPVQDKYQSFKTQFIASSIDSKEGKLHRTLTELKLDDKRPTQLLREMRSQVPRGISEDILHYFWM